MKRVITFLLALAMVLSLGVTAFAADEESDGSITITNATINDSYSLYKIFDATYSVGADGEADSVVYSIQKDNNKVFTYLFGDDGTKPNDYFNYNAETGAVTRKATAGTGDIIKYLTDMVRSETGGIVPVETISAGSQRVEFDELPYGYYLIDKGVGSAVTIDSNTPAVEVIDKNQKPGTEFSKLIWDEDYTGSNPDTRTDENGVTHTGKWVSGDSASVGDMAEWKVAFTATNYDGDDIVMYYSIADEKSSPLWVEFNDIQVFVDGNELKNGYYYCADEDIRTNEWEFLGEWTSGDPSKADWYLIHYTYDKFEIVIPWLDDCTFTGKQDLNQGFDLKFDLDKNDGNEVYSESKFGSPVQVELFYKASVGPAASGTTAKNTAHLEWTTPEGDTGPEPPQVTETKVYNMGVTKIANDGTAEHAATRLAGAVFELYSDAACTQPVYVIPTNNTGVYILDDVDTNVSGYNRITSREMYVGHWENYINGTEDNPNPNGPGNKRKDMVTPTNGQLVIMGLEAGTYYLKETVPPVGYNKLPAAQEVKVGPEGTAGTYSDSGYKDLEGKPIQFAVSKIEIENNKGVELPSTGGVGTMMMIGFGTMVAIAFAILMITQKKMSIYHD